MQVGLLGRSLPLLSTLTLRTDRFPAPLSRVPLVDFFGLAPRITPTRQLTAWRSRSMTGGDVEGNDSSSEPSAGCEAANESSVTAEGSWEWGADGGEDGAWCSSNNEDSAQSCPQRVECSQEGGAPKGGTSGGKGGESTCCPNPHRSEHTSGATSASVQLQRNDGKACRMYELLVLRDGALRPVQSQSSSLGGNKVSGRRLLADWGAVALCCAVGLTSCVWDFANKMWLTPL